MPHRLSPPVRRSSGPLALSLAAVAGFGFVDASVAQPVSWLPGTVVTATRSPVPRDDLLADVTVIGPEEIRRAGPEGLAALLARQPGIEILRNGGPGSVSSVFLRGANRGQTVVLIDGVRVGSSSNGAATLEAIPLERIDHIEILRGPASGLYGADAVGGVIQVFTRDPGGALHTHAEAGVGDRGTRTLDGGIAGSAGPLAFALDAGHRESRGFNAVVDPADFSFNPDRDGYASDSVSARLALPWAAGHQLSASALRSRLNAQFDAGPDFDDRTITVLSTWQVESRDRLAPSWLSRLSAAESVDDSLSRTSFGDSPFRTRQRQYAWQHDIDLAPFGIVAGVERREEHLDSDPKFDVDHRNTDAAFAIGRWTSGAQQAQANVRSDHSSQFGTRTTGGIAYAFAPAPGWRVRASAGTAFKLPTFNDLYYPGFSNPNLVPEISRSVEGAVTWNGTLGLAGAPVSLETGAVAYRNRVRDLIVFQCDANFVCAPQNVGHGVLEGVTLTLDARRLMTTVHASLDLQNPHDADNGHLLPRRARTHGALAVTQALGRASFTAEMTAASRRFDDAENTRPLAGYTLLNVAAEWSIDAHWSVLLRGDNVLDRDVRLASQYGNGGASVFAALRWRS